MTESQETPNTTEPTNPDGETKAIETTNSTQIPNSELNLNTSLDAQEKKEPQDVASLDSSTISNSNLKGDSNAEKESLEPVKLKGELLDKITSRVFEIMGMTKPDDKIYDDFVDVVDWLNAISHSKKDIVTSDIDDAWNNARLACSLMKQLLEYKEKAQQKIQELTNKISTLEGNISTLEGKNRDCNARYSSLIQDNNKLIDLTQKKETLEKDLAEAEASRGKLISELATLKRNTGTHYDGTSHRPQHPTLIGEYKTLKEQFLDPLAHRLFKFMAETRPELEQQQKEKTNYIKADISAIVLIRGQAIMKGERKTSIELPRGMLDEIQNVLREKLQLANNIPPEVSELLKKAASLAQDKIEYPTPGKWEEQNFQQVSIELRTCLCETLKLNFTSPSQEIQTDIDNIDKAIQNALRFLERAALADPPAFLSLEKEGAPFLCDYHEAAKGYDDEGKILKAIYPAYLVQNEAKVKAVVMTELSTPQYPEPLVTIAVEKIPVATTSSSIKDDVEDIIRTTRLEAKRDSVIKQFESKFIHLKYNDSSKTTDLLEKLKQINSLSIMETLEDAFCKNPDMNFMQFEQKLDNLLV
jgi:hypothetical protein